MSTANERQRARSEAHAAWDAEAAPGPGTRAAGLIAAAEGFDELARWLLSRLDPAQLDAPARCAAQVLDWRDGATGGPAAACLASLRALAPAAAAACWAQLFDAAFACALPTVAQGLLAHRPAGPAAACPDEAAAAIHLRDLGKLHGPGRAAVGQPLLLVADLPDGRVPTDIQRTGVPRNSAAERFGHLAAAAPPLAGWRRGLRVLRTWRHRRVAPKLQLARASASADHLIALPEGSIVLIDQGVIDRYTARHWQAALAFWPRVLISSLKMQDPAAATPAMIDALRRHEPVVAADACTALLLREWGVHVVLDGAHGNGGRPDLWNDRPPTARPSWWTRLGRVLGGEESRDARTVLEAWREWLEEARLADAGTESSPGWAPPDGPSPAALVDEVEPRRLARGPVRTEPPIELAFAVDASLAPYLPVTLESCVEHASLPLRVHVLARDIAPVVLADWQRLFEGRAELVIYPFDAVRHGEAPNLLAHTSVSTLDRLVLPDLLPTVQRAIYLDIDLVVTADLAELWRLDLGGRALAAKPGSSPGNRWGVQMLYRAISALPLEQAREVRRWLHATGPMGFRAFNAGVLLLDLARMRADGATRRLLSLVSHCAMNDQDALNAYTRDRYLPLANAWNAAPRQDVTEGAKIIHFVGPVKPWHELYISRKPEFERVQQRVEHRRRAVGHG